MAPRGRLRGRPRGRGQLQPLGIQEGQAPAPIATATLMNAVLAFHTLCTRVVGTQEQFNRNVALAVQNIAYHIDAYNEDIGKLASALNALSPIEQLLHGKIVEIADELGKALKSGKLEEVVGKELQKIAHFLPQVEAVYTALSTKRVVEDTLMAMMAASFLSDQIPRIEGMGHVQATAESDFIWKVGKFGLRSDGIFVYDFNGQVVPRDAGAPFDHSRLTFDEAMMHFQSLDQLQAIYEAADQSSDGRGAIEQMREDHGMYCLAVTLRAVLAVLRIPVFANADSNQVSSQIWDATSHMTSDELQRFIRRLSSVDACIQYANSLHLVPDWGCFDRIVNDFSGLTRNNFGMFTLICESRLVVAFGKMALFQTPFRMLVVSVLYKQFTDTPDSTAFDICKVLLAKANGAFYQDLGIAFSDGDLNSIEQRIALFLKASTFAVPVTFTQTFDGTHGVTGAFYSYIQFVNNWAITPIDGRVLYAPFFPIVQSSGSGKTRLIKEMVSRMPVYYTCLRPAENSSGRPIRSPVVADHLMTVTRGSEDGARLFFVRLLFHHYLLARNDDYWADGGPNSIAIQQGDKIFDTSSDQDGGFLGNTQILSCGSFWQQVTNTITEPLFDAYLPVRAGSRNVIRHSIHYPETEGKYALKIAMTRPTVEASSIGNAGTYLDLLLHSLPQQVRPHLPILVTFDEASELLPDRIVSGELSNAQMDEQVKKSRFYHLREATKYFKGLLVAVGLDTNSSLWNFAPVSKDDSSARVTQGEEFLADPYYHLPFPPHVQMPISLCLFTDAVSGLGSNPSLVYNRFEMLKTSRPLFVGSLDLAHDPSIEGKWAFLINFAMEKLQGVHRGNDKVALNDRCLSIFGARFPILPLDMHASQRLIAGNMATLCDLSGDRAFATIRYVAESLLGEASARITKDDAVFEQQFTSLTALIREGRVGVVQSRGTFGEFAASLLLARAFDKAHVANHLPDDAVSAVPENMEVVGVSQILPNDDSPLTPGMYTYDYAPQAAARAGQNSEPEYERELSEYTKNTAMNELPSPHAGAPVHFIRLLKSLLAPKFHAMLDRKITYECRDLVAGWCQFLQFIPNEQGEVSAENLWMSWRRHIATFTSHTYKGCDLILPIMILKPESGPSMTALFVEVKNQEDNMDSKDHRKAVAKLYLAARRIVPNGPIALMIMYVGKGHVQSRLSVLEPPPASVKKESMQPHSSEAPPAKKPRLENSPQEEAEQHAGNVLINDPFDMPELGDNDAFDKLALVDDSIQDQEKRAEQYKERREELFRDVLLISCAGLSQGTYNAILTPGQFQKLKTVCNTRTEHTLDLNFSDHKFGKTRLEMMKLISASHPTEGVYAKELKKKTRTENPVGMPDTNDVMRVGILAPRPRAEGEAHAIATAPPPTASTSGA